jgi:hypothetical protein
LDWTFARRWFAPVVTLAALGLVAALGVVTYQACAIYTPSLLSPPPDSGVAPAPGVCVPALVPSHPTDDGDAGPGAIDIAFALQSIDVGSNPGTDGGPYGWDLDTVCTCVDNGPSSCIPQSDAGRVCDDDAGRDHASVALFHALSLVGTIVDAGQVVSTLNGQLNEGLQAGQYSLLIQILGYNPSVANYSPLTVNVYQSNGLNAVEDGGTPHVVGDGTDKWTVDPGSIVNGQKFVGVSCTAGGSSDCTPSFTDVNAYVTNGVLVANLETLPVAFGNNSILAGVSMTLSSAVLTGKISVLFPNGMPTYTLQNGTLSGRWKTQALLSTLAAIPDSTDTKYKTPDGGLLYPYLCNQAPSYGLIKGFVCSTVADIASNSALDNSGAQCDAISVGMTFTATLGHLGDIYGVPPPPAGCPTMAGTPFSDTCPGIN